MRIVVVGAGPAGLMCAVKCSENFNNEVLILDGNEKIGKKLFITGKGRCNVCNSCDIDEFLKNVVNNNKFLYNSINLFSPADTITFFENNGTPLKIERGNRVFPVSDKSNDIIKTFQKILKKKNVSIILNSLVNKISKEGNVFKVYTNNDVINCDVVVIATGGKSYSSTGSKGDGYMFAKTLSHSVNKIYPALIPINLKDYDSSLAGLSLKNVTASINIQNKRYSQFGEMLFTHKGVSGPIILTLSSYINKYDIKNSELIIDLKPALSEEKLEERIIRDCKNFKNKSLKNYLRELLPSTLIDFFAKKLCCNIEVKMCNLTRDIRKKIVLTLKNLSFLVDSLEDIEYAIVTSGGVNVREINPKNMESKLVKNLFFIGEVLDIDALTGGFNIQIALSTGFCAGSYLKNAI